MDFISVSLKGTVTSDPERKGKDFYFNLRNERGKFVADFKVQVRNDERPIDVNKGDKVNIMNAGFYVRDGINNLVVMESSYISVERIRCNLGTKEV